MKLSSAHRIKSKVLFRQSRLIALAAAATWMRSSAHADVVTVGYQFTGETFNPTTLASNLTASSFAYVNANPSSPPFTNPPFIVQGGILPDDPPYYVTQSDWFPTADGYNENYYTFNVTVSPGSTWNVNSFSFEANSRQQVPFLTQVEYSTSANFSNPVNLDSNAFSISTAEDWNTYTASDSPILLGTGTYYFRVYSELDPNGNGTISDLLNMGNFALNGTVQPAAIATNLDWDPALIGSPGSGGSGTWLGAKTWAFGAADYPWSNSVAFIANFGGTAGGTVSLGGNVTTSGINFSTAGYTIAGTSGQTLTASGTIAANAAATISAALTTAGSGTLVVSGSSSLTIAGTASFAPGTNLAVDGGLLIVASGGSVIANGASQDIAAVAGSTATLVIQGSGSFATDSALNVADPYGNAAMNVSGSGVLTAGSINVDTGTGVGIVNQSGGVVTAPSVVIASGTYAIGTYNLTGGTLAAGAVTGGGGTSTFIFNGGTLQTTATGASLFSGIASLQIQSGGGTINTGGNNVTLAEAFTSTSGTFTKTGAGTLLVNGASNITGGVNVSGGTMEFVNTTPPSTSVTINSGGTLEYNYSTRFLMPTTTYNGNGTLEFVGGNPTFGPGYIYVDFSPGALIDVVSGMLTGSSSYGGMWTENEASLFVASGAVFDAVESGPSGSTQIDALNGAGTFQGGYEFNGNGGLTSLTIGVAGGSGTFSGNFLNDIDARLGIVKTGSGTETFSGTNSYAGGTSVNGGELVIASASSLPGNSTVSVSSTGVLQLASGIGGVTVHSLTITGSGEVDLTNNPLIVSYSGGSPVASIRSYLQSGYNSGAWNGPGINSSAVTALNAGQSKLIYSVGYADGADGITGVPSGEIEILPTLAGDAKLQGTVVFGDFQLLSQYFGQSGTSWDEGNFTYGSATNFGDFQLLSQNFGASASELTAGQLASIISFAEQFGEQLAPNGSGFFLTAVPEPTSAGMLAIVGIGLLARWRKPRRSLSHPAHRSCWAKVWTFVE
jgi:fibronectin-binding autotransporter adhesin